MADRRERGTALLSVARPGRGTALLERAAEDYERFVQQTGNDGELDAGTRRGRIFAWDISA